MAAASMRLLRQQPERLAKLRANVARLKLGMQALGLDVGDSQAPVATFVRGTAESMKALQVSLLEEGIYVLYSTYVGAGPHGAIRCAVFADHEPDHIDRLLGALRQRL